MAITEIIIPQLKKDAKSRHDFKEIWPTISQTFESLPAILNGYYGWIVNENGTDVKDDFKLILLFGPSACVYPGTVAPSPRYLHYLQY